jgi:adenine-specific DNA-methyltransferase
MASWYISRGCKTRSFGLLLGRIYLSIQSKKIQFQRQTILSAHATGCDSRACLWQENRGRKPISRTQYVGGTGVNCIAQLAKNLLRKDGFIFISIDENEIGNLRVICDDIFGIENFKGQITRSTGTPTGQGTERLVNELDYIVAYSRSSEIGFIGQALSEEGEKIYDQVDEKGRYLIRPLRKTGGEDRRLDRPSMYYPVEAPDGTKIYPLGPGGYESRWRCGPDTYIDNLKNGLIYWKQVKEEDDKGMIWKVYQKFYLEGRLKQPGNLWINLDGNKKASIEVRDLFDEKVFDFPKPVGLLRNICEISSSIDGVVLDFFAGSGTTGHAVMAQNAIDSGSRKYILVQLPEPLDPENKDQKTAADYCDKINKPRTIAELTKERLRRAGKKVREENPMFAGDTGFRVFKLASSNIRTWDPNRDDLSQTLLDNANHLVPGRKEQDVLFELLLKIGLDLTVAIEQKVIAGKTIYSVGGGALMACMADGIDMTVAEPLAQGILEWRKAISPAVKTEFVFKDSGFTDDVAKTNMAAIIEQNLTPEQLARIRSI